MVGVSGHCGRHCKTPPGLGEISTRHGQSRIGRLALLFPGDPYEFKLGGIWAGDDVSKGWALWEEFQAHVGLPLLPKSQIQELSPHDAVDVAQLAAAGRDFCGVMDSRKAPGSAA